MATPTYELIASQTLSSSALQVTFSSIPNTYRDLFLSVSLNGATADYPYIQLRFNNDSGSGNYMHVQAMATGSTRNGTYSLDDKILLTYYNPFSYSLVRLQANILDYAQTDKSKTMVGWHGGVGVDTEMWTAKWYDTAAINEIDIFSWSPQYNAGSTFDLYGIL